MDLFIERRLLSYFTYELVNCKEGGPLVYRVIHQWEPDRDRKVVLGDLRKLDPEWTALLDQYGKCKSGEYHADGVLDGVSYLMRTGGKVLALFCPDISKDPMIATLGGCLDAFFEKLKKE